MDLQQDLHQHLFAQPHASMFGDLPLGEAGAAATSSPTLAGTDPSNAPSPTADMLAVLAKSQQLGEERVVCDLCSIRRADVRTPCGHALHARCIYQLPLSECPVCRADMTQSEGLQVLPVEPHNNEPAENVDTELRTGRWHHYETQYAQHLIEDFEAGTLPIGEGTKLATLLCRLLNCNQTRLSKKLKIGKRFYAHGPTRIRTPEAIAAHSVRQRRISELEEMFLMAEAQTARGALTTPGLSEKMQTEWRERFVGHAHSMNQKLKDAWSWNSKRRSTTNTSAAINKLLSSIAPASSSNSTGGGDFSVSPMAPLFLVQHTPEGANGAAGAGSNNLVSTNDGTHHMRLYHPTPQMAHMAEYYSHSYHQHVTSPSPMSFGGGGGAGNNWFIGGLGDPNMGNEFEFKALNPETSDEGMDMWASLGDNLASLGYQNSAALGDGLGAGLLTLQAPAPEVARPPLQPASNRPREEESKPVIGSATAAAGAGGNAAMDDGGGSDDGDDDESSNAPFQEFVGKFLDQVPFEAVDVWVPLARQETGGRVMLFHAGYFTNKKELEEWGEYSTNFSFERGEGLPGRVFGSNTSEWQEDVHTLGHNMFLRLNGAVKTGIRTTFGVPVVSRKGVTFVIVFYSRYTVHVDPSLRAFVERTVRGWRFDAAVDDSEE